MDNKPIDRAKNTISREDFVRLLCLHKNYPWLDDGAEALFDLWNLSEDDNQKTLLEFLIEKFTFLNSSDLKIAGNKIASIIEKKWAAKHTNTYIVAICDNSKPDGSLVLLQSIKNKFSEDWSENNFINSIAEGMHNIPTNSIMVLIDDFIGTGDTVIRKAKAVKKKFSERGVDVELKIISLAAMSFSKTQLNTMNIEYESIYWLKKGISELLDGEKVSIAIDSMNKFEKHLRKKIRRTYLSDYKFGYKCSEALFVLDAYNIPNNVFPIFWWPKYKNGLNRNTIFRRSI